MIEHTRFCQRLVLSCLLLWPVGTMAAALSDEQTALAKWLDSYTAEFAESHDLAGVSTALTLPDGTTLRATAGVADLDTGESLTPTHRLLGGSTGKTYVAALVLAMASEGEIDLDAPLVDYLGEADWFGRLPNAEALTVQSLLNHSSGIAHYIDDWGFLARFAADRVLGNDTAYSPEQMLSFVFDEDALFPVGSAHHYSDLNYFLLGLVLEEVSGQPFYQLLQAQILDYLDLRDTTPSNVRRIARLATGYTETSLFTLLSGAAGPSMVDGTLVLDPAIEWTGGGLATTPGDLARFFFHLGSGNLAGVDGLDTLADRAIAIDAGNTTRYGNGVFISDRAELGRYFSHSGWYPGYTSNAAFFEQHGFSVAIQVSQDSGVDIYTPVRDIAEATIARLPLTERTSVDYQLVVADAEIGSQRVAYGNSGEVDIQYDFTSQGKVVDIDVAMSLDSRGVPVMMQRQGLSFLYRPIDEQYSASEGTARWRNHLENEQSVEHAGRYYVTYDLLDGGSSAPAETALLARAALREKNGTIALLPSGTASAEVLGWQAAQADTSRASLETQLIALQGLGLSPNYVWLDGAGLSFAEHAGGSIIRIGWRQSGAAQLSRQEFLIQRRQAGTLQALRDAAYSSHENDLLISNVQVFDSQTRTFSPAMDVLISNGRITDLADHDALQEALPGNAVTIDAGGKYLIPGLWDMHVHLNRADLLKHLAWGVTTVRDLGNQRAVIDGLFADSESGKLLGPRILRAGFIDKSGPYETAAGVLVDSLEEALRAVDSYADAGYRQIKLYGAIDRDWVTSLAERSHARGLRLGGHVPINGTTEQAIADGYDEITHFIYLWLNFAPEPVELELSYNTARLAAKTPYDSEQMQALVSAFIEGDIALDPTLAIYSDLLAAKPGEIKRTFAPLAQALPVQTARAARSGALPTPADLPAGQLEALFHQAVHATGELHRAGVDIVVGTDHRLLPGAAIHTELELLADAGIPNGEIIYLATTNPARLMGLEEEHGSIAPGYVADLVLLNENPLEKIRHTTDIHAVMSRGVYFPRRLLPQYQGN